MKRNTCTLMLGMLLVGLAPDAISLPVTAPNLSPDLPASPLAGEGHLADSPWKSAATRFDLPVQAPESYSNEPDLLAPDQTLAHAWHRATPGRSDRPRHGGTVALLPVEDFPALSPAAPEALTATGSLAEPATLTLLALGLCCLLLRERLAARGTHERRTTLAPASECRALVPVPAQDTAPFVLEPIDRHARYFPPRRRRAGAKDPVRRNLSSASRDSGRRSHDHKSTSALEKAAALRRARTSAATRPAVPKSARRGAPCPE